MNQIRLRSICLVVLAAFLACDDGKKGPGDGGINVVRADGGDGPATDGPAAEAGTPAQACATRACSGVVADLCCPTACSAGTDTDCGGCGNGRIETGETCDPPGTCPTSCPQLKCQKRTLNGAGSCAAACVNAGLQTMCTSGDECCPPGCNSASDRDCTASCGNGVVEAGESCNPVSGCVQSCPMVGCTMRRLQDAGTCIARCVEAGTQTQCRDGDGCCAPGCTGANDSDCGTCGNGTREPHEACDPLSTCPTACPAQGCRLRLLINPGTCGAVCVDAGLQSACANGDGCCPAGCNGANDNDCRPLCGNGVIEAGETCEPIGSCTLAESQCVSDATTIRVRTGESGSCRFRCQETPRTCGPIDGACPPGCGPTRDRDCSGCGNSVVEPGESCDPVASCAQAQLGCVSDDAMVRMPAGDSASCTFRCMETPRVCGAADGACPPGCGAPMDVDCAGCGNGRLDTGETCDPVTACQAVSDACVGDKDVVRFRIGDVGTCRFRCVPAPRTCGAADGFCPSDCTPTQDADCAGCGNGRLEGAETCDPPARCLDQLSACVSDQDFVRAGSGDPAACGFTCTATPRMCGATDGACPMGCGPMQDRDCDGCGNGRVEAGETCDPVAMCQEQARACVSDNDVIRTPSGDPAACGFSCAEASRVCGAVDSFCPAGCSPVLDVDCEGCGNGRLEGTETCDPVMACLAQSEACVSDANLVRVRDGDPATCRFECRTAPRTCGPADGECPIGCGPTMDVDCAGCGNGRLEPGETCDPVADCQQRSVECESTEDVQRRRMGSAEACTFVCAERPRPCGPADGACPMGCGPTTDSDCAGCGNGRLEPGETCDPLAECTRQEAACTSDRDVIRMGVGDPAMCQFSCVTTPRLCVAGDGFCPSTCGPDSDGDCDGCGNGRVEMGETCDPCTDQVAMCVSDANTVRTPMGDAALCTFGCTAQMRGCVAGDGVCPAACNPRDDADCRGGAGAMCRDNGDCVSNSCNRNGRCCAETCGVCQDCTAPAFACQDVPKGMPAPGCGDTAPDKRRCSGDGRCVQPAGATCDMDASCNSGFCRNSVCCGSQCNGVCQTCAGAEPGVCEPKLTVMPGSVDFGMVTMGMPAMSVRLTNACDTATNALSLSGLMAPFNIPMMTNMCERAVLPPGGSCTFSIRYLTAPVGRQTGTLTITGSQGGARTIAVSGTR